MKNIVDLESAVGGCWVKERFGCFKVMSIELLTPIVLFVDIKPVPNVPLNALVDGDPTIVRGPPVIKEDVEEWFIPYRAIYFSSII